MARNHRSSRRRGGTSYGRLLGILMLVLMPALMLGAGGYGLHSYMQIERMDAGFCYARQTQAQTAIFLDYSVNKDLSGAQRRDLVTALERAYDASPPNGRLMVFTTARDSSSSIAKPVFKMCRPAKTATEQEAIGAPAKTGPNLSHIAEEARMRFRDQVAQILADTTDGAKAALESPILEQVQAISRYAGFRGQERSLVWLSDGIQNSEIAKFCAVKGDMPSADRFMRRPDYAVVAPESFEGTDVTLLLVESAALPQPGLAHCTHAEMRTWWPDWFRAHGAERVRLERLRRVNGS
ncbi:MAG: hypothetical protein AAFX62_16605 [Pseudomonadota bacterium]